MEQDVQMRRPVRTLATSALVLLTAAACAGTGGGSSTQQGGGQKGTSTTASGAGVSTTRGGSGPTTATAAGWTTYQQNRARTGVDATSPPAGSVSRQWTSPSLDGDVYAQPLVVGGRVVVATEGNTLYSLDPATGRVKWSTNLGQPVDGSTLPCGDIDPSGITSTPVIDTATDTVWVVAFLRPAHHDLVAVDLATGQIRSRRSVDPPGADPTVEQERGALAMANGMVYVPYGGLFGDCGAYHGYVVGAPVAGGALAVWQAPTAREGGVWAPPGPSIDADGRLFVATGNGSSTSTFDGGDAVVRLSPLIVQEDLFAPANWLQLNENDTDLGSVTPTLLPDGLVFQIGKEGVGYLLDGNRLGGVGGERFQSRVCGSAFGGTAVSGTTVFVPCRDGLVALTVSADRFTVAWRGPANPAGTPVLAGGLVWELSPDGTFFGVDPRTGAVRFHDDPGTTAHFPAVAALEGQLFVPAGARVVAYGGI
jgi:outer membrane protein assembly factor BamB